VPDRPTPALRKRQRLFKDAQIKRKKERKKVHTCSSRYDIWQVTEFIPRGARGSCAPPPLGFLAYLFYKTFEIT